MTVDAAPVSIALSAFFLTFVSTILGGTKWMIVRMEQRTDRRFVDSEERWEARFARSESRLIARFEQVDKRFDQVDKRFEQVDHHLIDLDEKVRAVDDSLTEVKIAVARLEGPHPPFLIARG